MTARVAGVQVALGFDTSNVNGVILGAVPDMDFRICKATEGVGFTDRLFVGNRHAARAAGQVFGAYHFGHQGNGAAQADHFINTVNASGGFSGIGAVLDVELQDAVHGPSFGDVLAFGRQFARRVPGKPLVIYTGGWYWRGHLGNPTGLRAVPLWDSNYVIGGGTAEQILQFVTPHRFQSYGGWPRHLIRQYSSNATVGGHHPIDVNEHEGTVEDLKRAFGLTVAPVPRPVSQQPSVGRHPFDQLTLDGRLDRPDIDALQWWVGAHRDGVGGRSTTTALQRRIGARRIDGAWGSGTTIALQRFLQRYARRWWNPHLATTGNLDRPTIITLQRYLNRLAGY